MREDLPQDEENVSFAGNAILVVVTVGFLIASFPLAWMALGPVVKSAQALGWKEAEAQLISSYVDVPAPRQYLLKATYAYTWEGEEYTSENVFFDEMVGVRRMYYHGLSRELKINRERGQPLQIWVNPDSPDQSVIFRHVRWDKFAGNFLFFGIWSTIAAVLTASVIAVFRR